MTNPNKIRNRSLEESMILSSKTKKITHHTCQEAPNSRNRSQRQHPHKCSLKVGKVQRAICQKADMKIKV